MSEYSKAALYEIIEKPLEEDFGIAFVNTTYVAAVYEIQNMETGLTEWNQSGLVMGISFGTIIVGSMVTIFFCVGRVWMKKELFKAQCLQVKKQSAFRKFLKLPRKCLITKRYGFFHFSRSHTISISKSL
ncbi:hypothetical protein GCK72_012692 [Caenorhabditis remanei]|uniref:Uncharacterized protein n=1 Tax=Caenorhabditis remanei TaxID=31234 RepID=A0A6A5GP40_CAERE|nr:hypothetical protein GCK72_012692 [Caenorhabditis remanei]KAF1756239.1 hypothetical protein GCK72_012692 [Caenorhabditis remanei]